MKRLALAIALCAATTTAATAATLAPGLYDARGKPIYVGVEREAPDSAQNDFYQPDSGHTGPLAAMRDLRLRCGLNEQRRVIDTPQGALGVSLFSDGDTARPTVILIHGNDPETREMGFIIPYFVCNGVNVLSYDQRGTGQSIGNWFLSGPVQRADDVDAIYDAYRTDRHVDPGKIGVWGFSNGGWTAPLVALHRPIAFMLLKSAPTESLLSNIHYEVTTSMQRHRATDAEIAQALQMWQVTEDALYGKVPWNNAIRAIKAAEKQPWFDYSLMLKMDAPPSPAMAAGLRRAITYDPYVTLTSVTVPTLAMYGTHDRAVDEPDASVHMREYLQLAGARDVTVKTFPDASHLLELSKNGYDADSPERYAPGYPSMMLVWLRERGIINT